MFTVLFSLVTVAFYERTNAQPHNIRFSGLEIMKNVMFTVLFSLVTVSLYERTNAQPHYIWVSGLQRRVFL